MPTEITINAEQPCRECDYFIDLIDRIGKASERQQWEYAIVLELLSEMHEKLFHLAIKTINADDKIGKWPIRRNMPDLPNL